jgi:hypothetical protein
VGGQTDRFTDKQIDTTDRQTVDGQTDRYLDRQTDSWTDRRIGGQTDEKTNKERFYDKHFLKIKSAIYNKKMSPLFLNPFTLQMRV